MNLLNKAEEDNISVSDERGTTGGPEPLPPPHVSTNDPANVQIVNEFNSFNLENITPPIAPKWKHSEILLMNIVNSDAPANGSLMAQCAI